MRGIEGAAAVTNLPTDLRLSNEEYVRRLKDRLIKGCGDDSLATEIPIEDWRSCFPDDPEAAADSEMANFGDFPCE